MTADHVSADVERLVNAFRGYSSAVCLVATVSRCLWEHFHESARARISTKEARAQSLYRSMPDAVLRELLSHELSYASEAMLDTLLARMESAGVYERARSTPRIKAQAFNPRGLARSLLGGFRTDADLRYAVMRAIRAHYRLPLSLAVVHHFGQMSEEMTKLIQSSRRRHRGTTKGDFVGIELAQLALWKSHYATTVCGAITTQQAAQDAAGLCSCFLEACRALGYLSIGGTLDQVQFRADRIDSEYLISHLFGIPTNISGLDQLLGGGGLVLPEVSDAPANDPLGLWQQRLPARIMVVSGARGTGKSIFASQLASEIAARGGVSWFMPLEQSPEECVFALESMGALRTSAAKVAIEFASAGDALFEWSNDQGVLLILRPEDRDSLDSLEMSTCPTSEYKELSEFLSVVAGTARSLSCGNVRLVVIDPLNSRVPGPNSSSDVMRLRGLLRKAIRSFKNSGTNVLLVVEEQPTPSGGVTEADQALNELVFAENLADVIIRLSTSKKHNYATRYLEIRKSRTQREQRGDHAFAIRSGQGIRIIPSVASVHGRVRNRQLSKRVEPASFGLKCVDDVLGHGTLCRGDIVVLTGTSGTYKTQLGLPFLLAEDNGDIGLSKGRVSLLFTTRDSYGTTLSLLEGIRVESAAPGKSVDTDALRVIPLPVGHIHPGTLLQVIEQEVGKVELEGKRLHRILIDSIGLWEMCSPAVSEDSTFAAALVELLRTQRRTCMLICGVPAETGASLQRSLIGLSDCLIQFEKYEFRGVFRVMMRVLKSHGMGHRRDPFEVLVSGGKVSLHPSTSLLRRSPTGGGLVPIPIRLLFRTESELQRNYFKALRDSLRTVASPDTNLDSQDRVALSQSMGMGGVSAVDELQILEIDEFQLASSAWAEIDSVSLQTFRLDEGPGRQLGEVFPRFSRRCQVRKRDTRGKAVSGYRAVPFFANVGLLAFDLRFVKEHEIRDWEVIAERCWRWEQRHPSAANTRTSQDEGEPVLFFEYPRGSGENFNCLFFEILLSFRDLPEIGDGECAFRSWLASEQAVKAAAILRILCRRAYRIGGGRVDALNWEAGYSRSDGEGSEKEVFRVSHRAIVYRHWYTTLNEMFRDVESTEGTLGGTQTLAVTTLPGHVAVSGEWYLGIPSHSAASDAGMTLIQGMTTPDAELTRVRLGVGLPTRHAYYAANGGPRRLAISPYFDLDASSVECLVANAFSRSSFSCYEQVSRTLAHNLKKLVESPSGSESEYTEALRCSVTVAREYLWETAIELDFAQKRGAKTERCDRLAGCDCAASCRENVRYGRLHIAAARCQDDKVHGREGQSQ